jgi:hypothetical protein
MFENDPHAAEMEAAIANRIDDSDDTCPVCDGTGETHHPAIDDPEFPKCDGTGEA